ncbi:hypothetical protein [Mesoterricola silvestris]|uniref:Uncharacterized protein n=1 Tax=Mesoterricola silvestris TaxID=2927979 RepID=A0AA48K8R1_9BACT|nr:hypothetical protein [Mesoterricola silvestris]BDU72380.1 hypothetical protein METEAL_15540 [Mesoterricola silvestris]
MPDLKSIRQSLQEVMEDDATGKGSASRLAIVLTILALVWGLVACLSMSAFLHMDTVDLVKTFVYGLTGGGAGSYTVKRVVEAVASKFKTPSQE